METQQKDSLPPPPGIIASLRAGFDAVAGHISAILLPIALDVLLWLGPHVRLEQLAGPLITQFPDFYTTGVFSSINVRQLQETWTQFVQQFNLLGLLRTFPIGVSSLMTATMPARTPLGEPVAIEVPSFLGLVGWLGLLTVIGWICGGIYFHWISRLVSEQQNAGAFQQMVQAVLQTILLSTTWLMILLMAAIPGLIFLSVLAVISMTLVQIAIFLLALTSLWFILPVFFSPHGIFTREQNAFSAILSSIQMARFTMPTSSLFVLIVFLISQGLNLLWSVPEEASWMVLVGIAGHAFITTALLAASFIYYRDTNAWLQTVFERLKASAAPQM